MGRDDVDFLDLESLRFLCPADLPETSGIDKLCRHAVFAHAADGQRFATAFRDEAAALAYISRGPATLRPFGARTLAAFGRILSIFVGLGLTSIGLMEDGGVRVYPIARIMAGRESN